MKITPKQSLLILLEQMFPNRHTDLEQQIKCYQYLKKMGIKKHIGDMTQNEARQTLIKFGFK